MFHVYTQNTTAGKAHNQTTVSAVASSSECIVTGNFIRSLVFSLTIKRKAQLTWRSCRVSVWLIIFFFVLSQSTSTGHGNKLQISVFSPYRTCLEAVRENVHNQETKYDIFWMQLTLLSNKQAGSVKQSSSKWSHNPLLLPSLNKCTMSKHFCK